MMKTKKTMFCDQLEYFVCYLIDNCEGSIVSEENLHIHLADFSKSNYYRRDPTEEKITRPEDIDSIYLDDSKKPTKDKEPPLYKKGAIKRLMKKCAFPVLNLPDNDGWIEHTGTTCPVDGDVPVDVKFHSGTVKTKNSFKILWEQGEWGVSHYRLHKEEKKEISLTKEEINKFLSTPIEPKLSNSDIHDSIKKDWESLWENIEKNLIK